MALTVHTGQRRTETYGGDVRVRWRYIVRDEAGHPVGASAYRFDDQESARAAGEAAAAGMWMVGRVSVDSARGQPHH